ncbi:outer membrane protein assembly factor BamC [Ottowia sp.]|uniref:outer membrane protein assembly factor BamC n=1 Tax=Ottowia sp. TaxID=1898956 RepID=UPI002C821A87|nr:outer membrane protein assembly factor BamC [Ottowia sp.]HOB66553.1 outer membrane protein assembly factor BamC [Ottowia sp.]HPZ58066.1 outer membrane protein assembly factor BamC [Ottowia sp.]
MAATAAALVMSGCSVLEPDKIDYKSSGRGVSLEVPPDLSQLPGQSRYSVQGGSVTATGYQAGQTAAQAAGTPTASNQLADVHFMRQDGERWLRVDRPPEKLWGTVRDFWLESGFLLAVDQANMGIMETDWAENRGKIPQDFIRNTVGKVFDSLYSTGERDKFRTRMERNAQGGTDVYVTHRGMEEVYSSTRKDNTVWQPRARDPELEAEFLRRMMVKLGVSQERAKAMQAAAVTAQASTPNARVVSAAGVPAVQLNEDFDRAWRRVGLALDRTGFTVEDRDRSKGIYFVRYVDPTAEKKDPGFFGKLIGRTSQQLPTSQYQVAVRTQGQSTLVTVQDRAGAQASGADGQRIVQVLADELK